MARRGLRRLGIFVTTLVIAVASLVGGSGPASAAVAPYPGSMSALGDSITRGFNSAGWFLDAPTRSWSTGSHSSVNSHYRRILAVNPAISGRNFNDARTGAKVADLDTQARAAASRAVGYVTVLIGANDACTDTEEAMTPVDAFRAEFAEGMAVLAQRLPDANVLVVSVPDLKRLWEVGKDSAAARTAWASFEICQSMLARPTSTQQADADRRERVRQRVVAYNAAMAEVCAAQPRCRYDGGAVFNYRFSRSHLSTWDFFHPNTSGQAVLAEVSNAAGYQW